MKFVVAALLAAFAMPAFADDAGTPAKPLSVDAKVAGRSFAELTAQWWRWGMARDVAPWLDPDGSLCEIGQDGPVWFLAGTNGAFKPKRTCNVPEGKYVLLPVINMIYWGADDMIGCPCLKRGAQQNNDRLSSAVVVIDGVPVDDVERLRVATPDCFRWDESKPMSGTNMGASDGFWILLPPLSPGRHTISVGANYVESEDAAWSEMQQNFEYVLHVGANSRVLDL